MSKNTGLLKWPVRFGEYAVLPGWEAVLPDHSPNRYAGAKLTQLAATYSVRPARPANHPPCFAGAMDIRTQQATQQPVE